ncbi:eukaryotic translation initiation factor 4 gamma 3-like [Babylonia areolata]|uniref:eukaryotic translation initiation factor 4 gamma 3-like n=1 Tax=Babylonia areolata TaxID=304850 RepID=UPI003FD54D11
MAGVRLLSAVGVMAGVRLCQCLVFSLSSVSAVGVMAGVRLLSAVGVMAGVRLCQCLVFSLSSVSAVGVMAGVRLLSAVGVMAGVRLCQCLVFSLSSVSAVGVMATAEDKFALQYAQLCQALSNKGVVNEDGEEVTYRKVLMGECKSEFKKNKMEEQVSRMLKELGDAAQADSSQSDAVLPPEEMARAESKARHRALGGMCFFGELFNIGIVRDTTIHGCLNKLLTDRDDHSIECAAKLLTTVGKNLDQPGAEAQMDEYIVRLKGVVGGKQKLKDDNEDEARLEKREREWLESQRRKRMLSREEQRRLDTLERIERKSGQPPAKVKAEASDKKEDELCNRVKCLVLDVVELRARNWVQSKVKEDFVPTTISNVHLKAREEEEMEHYLNRQYRPAPSNGYGAARPKGPMQNGGADGRSSASKQHVQHTIDPKHTTCTKGSEEAGSRSQEVSSTERGLTQHRLGSPANRFHALNGQRASDSRHDNRPTPPAGWGCDQRGRHSDRRDSDGDQDLRRPLAKSCVEGGRAVANQRRSMPGAAPLTSSQPSRTTSRNNSEPGQYSTESTPTGTVVGVEPTRMSQEELNRRTRTIVGEFVLNGDFKETQECIAELKNVDYSQLIISMLEKVMDMNGSKSLNLGQLLVHMLGENIFTAEDIIVGVREFLSVAEDLELDMPKVWDYTSEVLTAFRGNSDLVRGVRRAIRQIPGITVLQFKPGMRKLTLTLMQIARR